ncbi:MAG: FAD-binding oxidoreductase [Proteobacteria bacterium]|nr:FAD-binding oxidoreductase [Pseudomonadota bacterium]
MARARDLFAEADLLTGEALAPYLVETRGLHRGAAGAVFLPRGTDQVAALMRLAVEFSVPVVAQGGNTGLVGGGVPFGGVVISLARMNRIRALDAPNAALTLEAGVVLQHAQEAAAAQGYLFPLSLASEGSCTIGGNIATNAGGTAVLRYGNMRDLVLGLEAVLPDGRIFNGLSALRKDNAGYDLKHLFIGSEGTLGIVTAAVLKLFPAPKSRATAMVAATSPEKIVTLFARLRAAAGDALTTFEIMPRFGLEIVLKHAANTRDPLESVAPWYALVELSAPDAQAGLGALLETLLGAALEEEEITDAVLAASEAQRADFWRLREQLSECQRHEGGSIKHDVSVPISRVADLIAEAGAACLAAMPGGRLCVFGHIGDGNLHFNVSQPIGMDKAVFLANWHVFNAIVHEHVVARGGSIAAEHGVGLIKRDELPRYKDPVALDLMVTIKRALDPRNLLNPGKVLDLGGELPQFTPGR